MKKICAIVVLLAALGGVAASQMQENTEDPYILASVEALTRNESPDNTGPAKQVDCLGGAHRMVCMCQNSYPCTGTECY